MPALIVILIQILCGVHIVRTGQERFWLYIILVPGIGCVIYALAVLLPDLLATHQGQKAAYGLYDKLFPERNIKRLRNQLAITPTSENYRLLADEYLRLNRPEEALPLYQQALTGLFQYEPNIMVKLAITQFECGEPIACRQTLTELMTHNPDYRSAEGHLYFARSVEACADWQQAQEEYEALIQYFSGPEAKLRYAIMLINQQQYDRAEELLAEICAYASRASAHYRRLHRYWLSQAKDELKRLTATPLR